MTKVIPMTSDVPAEEEAVALIEVNAKLNDAIMYRDISVNSLRWDLDQIVQTTSELCKAIVDGHPWGIARAAEARGVAKHKFEAALRRLEQRSTEVYTLEKSRSIFKAKPGRSSRQNPVDP